jgi:hypothetical protein
MLITSNSISNTCAYLYAKIVTKAVLTAFMGRKECGK